MEVRKVEAWRENSTSIAFYESPSLDGSRPGYLRRTLDSGLDPHTTPVRKVMTVGGKHISPEALAAEAIQIMQKHSIQGLLVIDEKKKLVGALNFQDLLRAGVE